VRFDDMLPTVIAQPAGDSGALAAAWLQIVDILAQDRPGISAIERRNALERLAHWREKVPVERRRFAAMSLSQRAVPFDVVSLFATDVPIAAAPVLSVAKIDDNGWALLIPKLPMASRALLRERRDLSPLAQRMLASFGSSDLALPAAEARIGAVPIEASLQTSEKISEIRTLVSRIEAFRRERGGAGLGVVPRDPTERAAPIEAFRFETGADGVVVWVDQAPRGPVIGIDIAAMAEVGEHGVDGQAAGAFRRRTPFRNARMIVPGAGPAAGQWLISGIPGFDEHSGRFTGYRCTARRPERLELSRSPFNGILGPGLPADSVRQLVHELRTPLNAIRGFAEMISGQLLGPVSTGYRAKAEEIIADSRRLLSLFEDLDAAAKLERGQAQDGDRGQCDPVMILQGLADEFRSLTDAKRTHLRLSVPAAVPAVGVDRVAAERMIGRLMSTVLGLAATGETIDARMIERDQQVAFCIARPRSIIGLNEEAMLDPSYGPEGEWPDGPALGLGFALRLIGNMARSAGGRLEIGSDQFVLALPQAQLSGGTDDVVGDQS
jgi:hypothetical protein